MNKKDFISLLSKYGFEIMNQRGKGGNIMYRHPLYKEIPVRTVNITDSICKYHIETLLKDLEKVIA